MNGTDKSCYYVSVQAMTVLERRGDAAYEFEIEATREDVNKLQELFNDMADADDVSFFRAHVPVVQYHEDLPNDVYDAKLRDIYRMIHELGTHETKRQIEAMNVL